LLDDRSLRSTIYRVSTDSLIRTDIYLFFALSFRSSKTRTFDYRRIHSDPSYIYDVRVHFHRTSRIVNPLQSDQSGASERQKHRAERSGKRNVSYALCASNQFQGLPFRGARIARVDLCLRIQFLRAGCTGPSWTAMDYRWLRASMRERAARTAARLQLLLRATMRGDVSACVLRSDIYASLSAVYTFIPQIFINPME